MKEISLNVTSMEGEAQSIILESYGTTTHQLQGELVYSPNQIEDATFYLLEGYVRLVNRKHCVSKIVGAGEFFGDRSIFYSEHIYAEALTPIKYIRINEPSYKQLLQDDVTLANTIVTSISKHYIYLRKKQSVLTQMKELITHIRKGHSIKPWYINWKKKNNRCVCYN